MILQKDDENMNATYEQIIKYLELIMKKEDLEKLTLIMHIGEKKSKEKKRVI